MNTNKEKGERVLREDLILREEVYAIVGVAMEVHNVLGAGFLEAVYQEAMAIEFQRRCIPFEAQKKLRVRYKDCLLEKEYCADFVCHGQVLVEIKAIKELSSKDEAQLLNYLKATGLRVGLVINFGDAGRLDWHRLVR